MKERTLVPAPGQFVLRGVEAVSELPAAHYPPHGGVADRDELANQPQTLN
ncbi:MAG: hypothetical protein LH491_07105 [Pseudoxanthomonas sp.]|nr:hypothetical protein [Pseudoxanthomonas sp.]